MHEIETTRLYLRPFQPDDLEALALIYTDPEVMRYMRSGKPRSFAESEITLDWFLHHQEHHGFGMWAVIDRADDRLIGQCGLLHMDDTAEVEVAYLLDKAYWGKGLAEEAARAALQYGFEKLGLPQIVAVTRPENLASQRVLEKIGLHYQKEADYFGLKVCYFVISREAGLKTLL